MAAVIFIGSSHPNPLTLPGTGYSDKFMHFFAYTILSYLTARALLWKREIPDEKRYLLGAIVLVALYGVSDEFHQYFVPERDASAMDLLADFIGSFCGAMLFKKANDAKRVMEREGES